MAKIRDEVLIDHLIQWPLERPLLVPFLHNFDVNWARRRRAHNTELSIYFLAPEKAVMEQFGFESEILLAVSEYDHVQPRTMQAVDQILSDDPARGRVDQMAFFLVSRDVKARDRVADYCAINPQSRLPIVLSFKEVQDHRNDSWFVRSAMSQQLYTRDLFKDQLPIQNDLFFFGRDHLVAEIVSAIRQSENRGLFGLRKTGKTSVLFKVKRLAEQSNAIVLYYDCKSPAVRNLRWEQFLQRIIDDIGPRLGNNKRFSASGSHITDRFRSAISSVASAQRRISIIFDEIEWISHLAKLDEHWQVEFVPFWQTMWTTQSEIRALSLIIAGLNPAVVEVDSVAGVQNPLFGIVSPRYITGLEEKEIRSMLHHFGKRMGLRFDLDAATYLYQRYGGHPLLTRMACSYVNTSALAQGQVRPTDITRDVLVAGTDERERELSFYCRHIVSELKSFYPDEYHMLEMLAGGNVADFMEMSVEQEYIKHLSHYGLIETLEGEQPRIAIPVLRRFINLERARIEGKSTEFYVVPSSLRANWLAHRVRRITDDLRQLEKVASESGKPRLYGEHGFPEAERFNGASVVTTRDGFASFINVCNRCFVEAVERTGRSQGKPRYLWTEINHAYPDFWLALRRVKLFRNEEFHLTLNDKADANLDALLNEDLLGRKLSQVEEPYFVLQQAVIDGLFVGGQVELDRLA